MLSHRHGEHDDVERLPLVQMQVGDQRSEAGIAHDATMFGVCGLPKLPRRGWSTRDNSNKRAALWCLLHYQRFRKSNVEDAKRLQTSLSGLRLLCLELPNRLLLLPARICPSFCLQSERCLHRDIRARVSVEIEGLF